MTGSPAGHAHRNVLACEKLFSASVARPFFTIAIPVFPVTLVMVWSVFILQKEVSYQSDQRVVRASEWFHAYVGMLKIS